MVAMNRVACLHVNAIPRDATRRDTMTTAHIFKAKGGGWTLLKSKGAGIVGAITIGTYLSKAQAKRIAAQLGLKAHNY